jgi:hypothetical protein
MAFWGFRSPRSFTISNFARILRPLSLCDSPIYWIIVTSVSFILWIPLICCLASVHVVLFENWSLNSTLNRETLVCSFVKISFLLLFLTSSINRHSRGFIYLFWLYILCSSCSLRSNRKLLIRLQSRFRSIILVFLSQALMLIILLSLFSDSFRKAII